MIVMQRAAAGLLLAVGGIAFAALTLAALAATIYFNVVAVKMMLDGNIVGGIITGSVVLMVAVTAINLVSMPFAGMMALGEKLWDRAGGRA